MSNATATQIVTGYSVDVLDVADWEISTHEFIGHLAEMNTAAHAFMRKQELAGFPSTFPRPVFAR